MLCSTVRSDPCVADESAFTCITVIAALQPQPQTSPGDDGEEKRVPVLRVAAFITDLCPSRNPL